MPRTDILERKEDILKWIEEERPKNYMCQQLGCKQETLNKYLLKMNINYSGQQNKKGQQKGSNTYRPASYYFDNQHTISSFKLKEKLFKDGLKEQKCEICGISEWQGIKLPLELHHKNNNHNDNSFDNLQILCPNCHSIQEGNSGANIGKYTTIKEEEFDIQPKEKNINLCIDCGIPISDGAKRCEKCYHKSTKIEFYEEDTHIMRNTGNEVNREELKKLIRTTPFVRIGAMYGVSDNAIRKWCDRFNLPRKPSEIKKISDEDWVKI